MTIAIMSPSARSGDAVGFDALSMYRVLKRAGAEVVLLTRDGRDELSAGGTYADALGRLSSPDDLLIYHACTDDPEALRILRAVECRTVVKYHNITPPGFFAGQSPDFARACRLGRASLATLAQAPVSLFLCDSAFNARDLEAHGVRPDRLALLPPFHPTASLIAQPDDHASLRHIGRHAVNLLVVGRVVPNKRLDVALEVAAKLKAKVPGLHLQIVGQQDVRLRTYHDGLAAMTRRLRLTDTVSFHREAGAPALATYYRHCDALLMCSDHEGFGVPAVEAMAFGLPVAAIASSALPETLGEAGALASNAAGLAAQLALLLEDDGRREALIAAGRRRYRETFAPAVLEARFLAVVADTARSVRPAGADAAFPDPTWFGLPGADRLPARPRDVAEATLDGQRRAVEATLRSGAAVDRARFQGEAMRRYVDGLQPPHSAHIRPRAAKLAWCFSPGLQARFALETVEDARDFSEWFWRTGLRTYPALAPLLSETETRFAAAMG